MSFYLFNVSIALSLRLSDYSLNQFITI